MDINCDNLLCLNDHGNHWRPLSKKQSSREAINHLAFSKHQGIKIPLTAEKGEAVFITAKPHPGDGEIGSVANMSAECAHLTTSQGRLSQTC